MKKLPILTTLTLLAFVAAAQVTPLNIKCIGGSLSDNARVLQMIGDDTFIVAGSSYSSDGDLDSNSGFADCWFVQLDTSLNILKSITFGESGFEFINDVYAMSDTSFLLLINGNSTTGAFSAYMGGYDTWIRSYYPNTNWLSPALAFGGSNDDIARHISPKTAGGYLVCGRSYSNDVHLPGNYGASDVWVMSLSSTLTASWSKNFGGSGNEEAIKVFQLSDGNMLVFGNTNSSDGLVSNFKGAKDVWVLKLNSLGDTLWTKCLGGTGYDEIVNVVEIMPDQFALVGNSNSPNGDFFYVKNSKEKIMKSFSFYHVIDGNGDFVMGGSKVILDNDVFFTDIIYSCGQDIDVFGFIDTDTGMSVTNHDILILNYNNGVILRTDTFGGNNLDGSSFLRAAKLNESDFLIVASTLSDDLNAYHGEHDILLTVLREKSPSGISEKTVLSMNIFPNPATHKLYIENLPLNSQWVYNLSDISGKVILSGVLNADNSIDVSALNNGVYLLSVSDGKLTLAKKVLVD